MIVHPSAKNTPHVCPTPNAELGATWDCDVCGRIWAMRLLYGTDNVMWCHATWRQRRRHRAIARRHARLGGNVTPWHRWIDPDIATGTESSAREIARLRAELAATRDRAIDEFGPLEWPFE
jgi:hypothetical protein